MFAQNFNKAKVTNKQARRVPFHVVAEQKGDRRSIMRRHALRRLITDIEEGMEKMAVVLELPENRVTDMLEGRAPIEDGMAMHIEEMLRLSAGWLESGDEVPESVIERLSGSVDEVIAEKKRQDAAPDELRAILDAPEGEEREIDIWAFDSDGNEPETNEGTPDFSPQEAFFEEKAGEAFAAAVAEAGGYVDPDVDAQALIESAGVVEGDQEGVEDVVSEERKAKDEVGMLWTEGLLKVAEAFPGLRRFMTSELGISDPTATRLLCGKHPMNENRRVSIEMALRLAPRELERIDASTIAKIMEGVAVDYPDLCVRVRRGRPPKGGVVVNEVKAARVEAVVAAAAEVEKSATEAVEPEAPVERTPRASDYMNGVPAHPPLPYPQVRVDVEQVARERAILTAASSDLVKAIIEREECDQILKVFLARLDRKITDGEVTPAMAHALLGVLL